MSGDLAADGTLLAGVAVAAWVLYVIVLRVEAGQRK